MTRNFGHCIQDRPYALSLEDRTKKAMSMIGDMCKEHRPPYMAIPANGTVHHEICHDEDLFICDILEDLLSEVQRIESQL